MGPRPDLHALLVAITPKVYFQPPPTLQIEYPCIIYERDALDSKHADNYPYALTKRYMITVIDEDPDSELPIKVAQLPMSTFNRFFTADQLNHDVFSVYF